jgi:hypothetical protein
VTGGSLYTVRMLEGSGCVSLPTDVADAFRHMRCDCKGARAGVHMASADAFNY